MRRRMAQGKYQTSHIKLIFEVGLGGSIRQQCGSHSKRGGRYLESDSAERDRNPGSPECLGVLHVVSPRHCAGNKGSCERLRFGKKTEGGNISSLPVRYLTPWP
eukprot:270938-Rhodomonas_salina.1